MGPVSRRSGKALLTALFHREKRCVLSTVAGDGKAPESALVAFSQTRRLEIIFGTFRTFRKYRNLQKHPRVSLVVGFSKVSVQAEGVAREVSGAELERCRRIHLAKHPRSRRYAFDPEQRFFLITLSWVRYLDYSVTPEQSWEMRFPGRG